VLQDDVVKFISDPPSPPQLEDVPVEGKDKAKELHKVSEGDDTVAIEDTSDDEDENTLKERFQLRSRFSRAGIPNIPVTVETPANLEASIVVLPRRTCNATWKCATKKLKITETTN
jgi:hypothetical protein